MGGNYAHLPFSQKETPHFFQPWRQMALLGVIFEISQTKIADRVLWLHVSSVIMQQTTVSLIFIKKQKVGNGNAKATAFNVSLPSQLKA